MDSVITFAAKYLVVFSLIPVVYLLFRLDRPKRKEFAIVLVTGGVLSYLLAKIGHHFHNDPRPFISDHTKALFDSSHDNGFPSDHTLLASFLGFATLYYSRKLGVLLLLMAAVVAWGRVAGHVHHLTDVIASFIISGVAMLIVVQVVAKARPKLRSKSK